MRLIVPAVFLALLIAMLTVAGPRIDWRAWFDGPERGNWRAVELDGEDVRELRLSVAIADGEIVAGNDGCNSWWRDGEPDPETGEQGYMSTLVACEERPTDRAYSALAFGDPDMRLVSDDRLELTALGHRGTFIRWTRAMADAEREEEERAMEEARRNMPTPVPMEAVPPPAMIPPPAPAPPHPPLNHQGRDDGREVPPPVDVPARLPPQR